MLASLLWLFAFLAPSSHWYIPNPLDQHGQPTCVAAALLGWEEAGPAPVQAWHLPNIAWLYHAAQVREGQPLPHDGTQTGAGWQALTDAGLVLPDSMRFTQDPTVALVWLHQRGVILTSNWYESMNHPIPGRPLTVTFTPRSARHAVFCYAAEPGDLRVDCLQSWGVDWGDAGRFTLRTQDFAALIREGGDVSTADKWPPHAQ